MAHTILNPNQSDKKDKIRDRLVIGVFHHFEFPSKFGPLPTKDSISNYLTKVMHNFLSNKCLIENKSTFQNGKFSMLLFAKAIKFSIVNKNPTKGTQPYINAKTGFKDAVCFYANLFPRDLLE